MKNYLNLSLNERQAELQQLRLLYDEEKKRGYQLDMSRGKPAPNQLDMNMELLFQDPATLIHSRKGTDIRNYGELAGVDEAKELFAEILGLKPENIIMGGQSSLALMYDCVMWAYVLGVHGGNQPWCKQGKVKFLCPVPGYDRHFRILEEFGIEMINVPMTPQGPDMAMVREYVEKDPLIKGIWCVPKYSNPQGYTYSAETVEAFAALKPAADDFRIFWDNAYIVHCFRDEDEELVNIFDACKKYGSENMVYEFASTSKITFSGAGLAVIAASADNIRFLLKQMSVQTLGYDKINQIRHVHYFKNADGVRNHMKILAHIIRPKFDTVLSGLDHGLRGSGIGSWTAPGGGYFLSYDGLPGTAKRCVELCADLGIKMTPAGATFPYGIDPEDRNIRIAPSFPSLEQLKDSMRVFCLCQRIAALEALNKKN